MQPDHMRSNLQRYQWIRTEVYKVCFLKECLHRNHAKVYQRLCLVSGLVGDDPHLTIGHYIQAAIE